MDQLLSFAHELADAARQHLQLTFRRPFEWEAKSDSSPVTEVDRAVEKLLRERIRETFPEHGILGEEFGAEQLSSERIWVLDPIDGTRSFVSGKPLFGSLIGLFEDRRPVMGVIEHPAVEERWSASAAVPTRFQGEPARVQSVEQLADAILGTTAPHLLEPASAQTFEELRGEVRDVVYGCDCYAYGLLASGHVHAVIEEGLGVHDWCALVPVVEGAGGVCTDWQGEPLRFREGQPSQQLIAASSQELHAQLLERFRVHAQESD